ncbi:MAG: cupredoxin domain-containing protein [Gemmatimonadaceae bacterium]
MRLRFVTVGAALAAAACGNLSHPLSNDGADSGNPIGANPGSTTLFVDVDNSTLTVGETASITGSLGGAPLQNNGLFTATSSDSSVATVGGLTIFARSVGSAMINASYSGYHASSPIGISVVPTATGVAALVADYGVGGPAFVPQLVTIPAGLKVSFGLKPGHNVVFDSVPGAPADISPSASTTVTDIQFPVAGTFTYKCTIHGETGTIVVTP